MRRWWSVALISFYVGIALSLRHEVIGFLRTGETRYAVNLVGSLVFTISGTIPFLLGRKRTSRPSIIAVLIVAAFAGFWLVDYPQSLEKLGILLILVALAPVLGSVLYILERVMLRVVIVTALVSVGFIGTLTVASLIDVAAALYAVASILIIMALGYLGYSLVLDEKLERREEKYCSTDEV